MKNINLRTLGVLLLALIVGGVLYYLKFNQEYQRNNTAEYYELVKKMPDPSLPELEVQEKELTYFSESIKEWDGHSYKKVRVSNGEITFTFEIPENWITQTRTKSDDELKEELSYMENSGALEFGYPHASVSADEIWYGDGNAYQTDFYIIPTKEALKRIEETKAREEKWLSVQDGEWTDMVIQNKKTKVYQSQFEIDGESKGVVTKGGSGHRTYYIDLDQKTLVIYKQAYMGDTLEVQFDHLIETLRFE